MPSVIVVDNDMTEPAIPKSPRRGPPRAAEHPWLLAFAALLSPLVVVLVLIWWILGLLLTLPSLVVTGTSIGIAWTLYLCLPGIPMGLLDWPIVLTVGFAAVLVVNGKQLTTQMGLALVLVVYSTVRTTTFDRNDDTTRQIVRVMTAFGWLLPIWLVVSRVRLWLPADEATLEEMEHKIYKKYLVTDYNAHKVAGLGTVHVPYCGDGDATRLPPRTLVLVHGYMAGNAFWAANLQALAKYFNVYAVEWKGIGRSNRPRFNPKTDQELDAFFVESLEEWRRTLQLDRFILVGHSMGGIYTTYYSERYAQHVEHLILVSPAGVNSSGVTSDELSFIYRLVARHYITPMSLIRFAGPFGPSLVQWILRKRITWVPETNVIRTGEMDFEHITAYCYHNWALRPSGEIALYTHLHPGASAQRRPISDVLQPTTVRVPVTFLYGGGGDWMPSEHGEAVVRRLEKTHYAAFRLVPSAGHQVFMDNPHDFNRIVIEAVHDYEHAVARGTLAGTSGAPVRR